MCRITGFWDPSLPPQDQALAIVQAMRDTMTYGGPDDAGSFYDPESGLALGHRRLAILDLSSFGHQPMLSSSGRWVIVFNGEVYNYRQLAKELESDGRRFKGHSDTEVILEAVEAWGVEKAVSRFIGMFALALWDRVQRTLYLVRDRIGIKPLYYGWIKKKLVFASELKALRSHPGFEANIDQEALCLFFRHNYIPAPYSIYQKTFKLPPGRILTITQEGLLSGKIEAFDYWSVQDKVRQGLGNPFPGTEKEAEEELEKLLREAVSLRLIADVPLGAFLSGGIDSSTVVALMQAEANAAVHTFSIGFDHPAYNEAPFARKIADHLSTDHTEMYVTDREAREVIPQLPSIYDEPFSDSSQIPTYLLCKLTRRYVTVSLSGDGGDELFCGYDRYLLGEVLWRRIGWMPVGFRKGLCNILLSLTPSTWEGIIQKISFLLPPLFKTARPGDRIYKLAASLLFSRRSDLYLWLVSHWREPAHLVLGVDQEPVNIFDRGQCISVGHDFLQEMQYWDLTYYLPDDLLTKVDRASMAVALEARVPLLDHRVVEFAWRLPLPFKVKKGRGKRILRKILSRYVPERLFERPKMGFGVPIDSWLRGPLKDWAEDLLNEERIRKEGYLNPIPIREKWLEHQSGKQNWQYHLWDVLMWESWLEAWR